MSNREAIAADCREMADILGNTASLDKKIDAAQNEMNEVVALNSAYIRSHSSAEKADEFAKNTAEYDERYKKAEARLTKYEAERKEHLLRQQAILSFAEALLGQPLILEQWDEQLWNLLVQKAVVFDDGKVVFTFRGENTITVRIE